MGWIFYEAYALAFAGHGAGHLPHRLRRLPSERAPGDSYAVYDIDNDGREELLFSLSGTTYVWEYRDSVLYEELRAFTYGLIIKCKNACRDAAGIFNCILAVFTC